MSTASNIFGKYQLIERINVGGMAEVYKARLCGAEGFARLVAIKRILPEVAVDEDFVRMFIDEAKIAVLLSHPNIAQIYDLGREGESWFIALEYVSGRDLRAVLERLRRQGRNLPPRLAAFIVARVAEGLDYAHRRKDPHGHDLQLVHRDISPPNVLVSFDGEVKIVDFGIAKAATKAQKTQAGILKGKFGYMSPEQVRGVPVDRRSDLFATGTLLFELLTGERLFTGKSDYEVLEKVRRARVPLPVLAQKQVPPELEAVLLKALEREPDDRYQWASELAADLNAWLAALQDPTSADELGSFLREHFLEILEHEKNSALTSPSADAAPRIVARRAAGKPSAVKASLRAGVLTDDSPRLRVPPRPAGVRVGTPDPAALNASEKTVVQSAPEPLGEGGNGTDHPFGDLAPKDVFPAASSGRGVSLPLPVELSESIPTPPRRRPPPVPLDDLGAIRALEHEPTRVRYAPHRRSEEDTRVGPAPAPSRGDATAVVIRRRLRPRRSPWLLVALLLLLVAPALGYVAWQGGDRLKGLPPIPWPQTELVAGLRVTTEPAEARVTVEGRLLERAADGAFVGEVPAGEPRVVSVRAEGFRDFAQTVRVPAEATRELHVALQPIGPVVELRTDPPGAALYVDGERVGKSPLILRTLPPGRYAVGATLRCHSPVERTLALEDADVSLVLELKPIRGCVSPTPLPNESGLLLIHTRPAGAQVIINEQKTRLVTPVQQLRLPPGTHEVKLVKGPITSTWEVEIRPRKTSVLQVELE